MDEIVFWNEDLFFGKKGRINFSKTIIKGRKIFWRKWGTFFRKILGGHDFLYYNILKIKISFFKISQSGVFIHTIKTQNGFQSCMWGLLGKILTGTLPDTWHTVVMKTNSCIIRQWVTFLFDPRNDFFFWKNKSWFKKSLRPLNVFVK